jgi:hypothetical protein
MACKPDFLALLNCCLHHQRQIIGIIASLERFLADAEERGVTFLQTLLQKQHSRLKGMFDRHVVRKQPFSPVIIS